VQSSSECSISSGSVSQILDSIDIVKTLTFHEDNAPLKDDRSTTHVLPLQSFHGTSLRDQTFFCVGERDSRKRDLVSSHQDVVSSFHRLFSHRAKSTQKRLRRPLAARMRLALRVPSLRR
jgi:hypothetical protein